MPGGGAAPIKRSRVIPPTLAAANESTSTPKMSSRCLMPAIAPLNANTNVPKRSSTSTSVLMVTARGGDIALGREPGQGTDHQRLHARFERRMDDRCEARVVVGRKLTQAPVRFCLCVHVGVGPADEPEHRRRMPLGAERAEILARGRWSSLHYPIDGKVLAKRVRDAPGRVGVVRHQIVV